MSSGKTVENQGYWCVQSRFRRVVSASEAKLTNRRENKKKISENFKISIV